MNIEELMENARLKGRVIALEAEVQTLTAEVRCFEAVIRSNERVDSLIVANPKGELERLRKAGDALALSVGADWAINGPEDGTEPESVKDWNAAKEGKPSV